jgi:nucleotide-binding universal stress UspA family protein
MVHSVREPGVEVRADVLEGLPARVLLDQAIGADMLVLGSASHAQMRAAGPVVRACVSRAPCPVVVVGEEAAAEAVKEPAHAVVAATAGGWIADS